MGFGIVVTPLFIVALAWWMQRPPDPEVQKEVCISSLSGKLS
jgi:hypothetical protein